MNWEAEHTPDGCEARLAGYDWHEAFACAGEEGGNNTADVRTLPGQNAEATPFARVDVEHIEKLEEGDNDGPDWICLGRLKDGRWFFLRAGCDYTGWDCQSGGHADVGDSLDAMLRWSLSNDERRRLGYPPHPETDWKEHEWG